MGRDVWKGVREKLIRADEHLYAVFESGHRSHVLVVAQDALAMQVGKLSQALRLHAMIFALVFAETSHQYTMLSSRRTWGAEGVRSGEEWSSARERWQRPSPPPIPLAADGDGGRTRINLADRGGVQWAAGLGQGRQEIVTPSLPTAMSTCPSE